MQVRVGLRAHAKMMQPEASGVGLALFELDLASRLKISFIRENNDRDAVSKLIAQLLDPVGHHLKAVDIGDIVHNYCALSVAIVDGVHRMVLLLASCVPDAQLEGLLFELLAWVTNRDQLLRTVCVDCFLRFIGALLLAKAIDNRGFTDARFTQYHNLEGLSRIHN